VSCLSFFDDARLRSDSRTEGSNPYSAASAGQIQACLGWSGINVVKRPCPNIRWR